MCTLYVPYKTFWNFISTRMRTNNYHTQYVYILLLTLLLTLLHLTELRLPRPSLFNNQVFRRAPLLHYFYITFTLNDSYIPTYICALYNNIKYIIRVRDSSTEYRRLLIHVHILLR